MFNFLRPKRKLPSPLSVETLKRLRAEIPEDFKAELSTQQIKTAEALNIPVDIYGYEVFKCKADKVRNRVRKTIK